LQLQLALVVAALNGPYKAPACKGGSAHAMQLSQQAAKEEGLLTAAANARSERQAQGGGGKKIEQRA
jgi:hypothetical protein